MLKHISGGGRNISFSAEVTFPQAQPFITSTTYYVLSSWSVAYPPPSLIATSTRAGVGTNYTGVFSDETLVVTEGAYSFSRIIMEGSPPDYSPYWIAMNSTNLGVLPELVEGTTH